MKRERGHLRSKACTAKQRLLDGFWAIEENRSNETITSLGSSEYDNELYTKIAFLISGGISNPLGHVLDKDSMEQMSLSEKERYVFSMSNKVRELTERYFESIAV